MRTPEGSPESRATICPIGVETSKRSLEGACDQVKCAATPSLPRFAERRPDASNAAAVSFVDRTAEGATVAHPASTTTMASAPPSARSRITIDEN